MRTDVVHAIRNAVALGAAAAALAVVAPTAIAADASALPEGFTCCNLHYNKDWISDANWNINPMIPAGTPIKVLSYGHYRAFVELDGKPFTLGQDYGRDQESLEAFTAKWVVAKNPKAKLAAYPEKIREAIHLGKVAVGMNREQALVAVGYPPTHHTASIEAPTWNLWSTRTNRYQVIWSEKRVIKEIIGQH